MTKPSDKNECCPKGSTDFFIGFGRPKRIIYRQAAEGLPARAIIITSLRHQAQSRQRPDEGLMAPAGAVSEANRRPRRRHLGRRWPLLCLASPNRRWLMGKSGCFSHFIGIPPWGFLLSSPVPFSSFVTERRNKKGATVPDRWTTGWGPYPQYPRPRFTAGHPTKPCSRPYLAGRGERATASGKVSTETQIWRPDKVHRTGSSPSINKTSRPDLLAKAGNSLPVDKTLRLG